MEGIQSGSSDQIGMGLFQAGMSLYQLHGESRTALDKIKRPVPSLMESLDETAERPGLVEAALLSRAE